MKRFCLLLLVFSCLFFSCEEEIEGCTDTTALNYNSDANIDNGLCEYAGCVDSLACNYNPDATEDDGSCVFPGDSILEIIDSSDDYVIGVIGEEVEANVHLRNSSCETVAIKARKMFSDTEEFESYFCFAEKCFGPSEITSPTTLFLDSYEEDDYFKSYFNSSVEGVFELKYRFFLENDLSEYIEKTITYEITAS